MPFNRKKKILRRGRRIKAFFAVLIAAAAAVYVAYNMPSVHRVGQFIAQEIESGYLLEEAIDTVTTIGEDTLSFVLSKEMLALYVILVGSIILLENNNSDRTTAWLLVLFLLPVVGLILYFIVGPRSTIMQWFKQNTPPPPDKHLRNIAHMQLEGEFPRPSVPENWENTVNLLIRSSDAPLMSNNMVKVLTDGEATFGAIFDALRLAEHFIHMEYFGIADDDLGNQMREILQERAKAGVSVLVIYDAVGSHALSDKYLSELRESGAKIVSFIPVSFPMLRREYNYRTHRKIVVVDGIVGFTGGLNVGDMYMGLDKHLGFWRDTHLEIRGDSVGRLNGIFLRDWGFCTRSRALHSGVAPCMGIRHGDVPVQIATSGPDSHWASILQGFCSLISRARSRVWIVTPYLVPSPDIISALKIAALSGVDVRIIIPAKADHHMVYWASRGNIDNLLTAGIRVYAYENGFIHAKIMIVDSQVASVGTTNMDLRSLQINYEVQAFIYDSATAVRLEEDFVRDLEGSREFTVKSRAARPLYQRVLESLARLMSPQL